MKNKGFTLVEMLAVLLILGLLIGIGVFTVNNIKDNAEKNYYVSMEDTLKIAGNDYFNDNREDRPIDDYNFVSLETLEDHEYLDVLKTYDKKENCDKSSGVYIYNTDNGNEYEVCLKCGIHKSTGPYCNGKKTGQIMITGRTNTGAYYNPTLSYVGTPWVNASSVNVTFTLMGDGVTTDKFEIYNGNTNSSVGECTSIHSNSCTTNMSVTGSYYVIAYNGSEKVGNRKYFNVKIDNTPPTFDIKDQEPEKDLEDGYEYPYNNEVINIHDDNGYKSVTFSLIEIGTLLPRINIVNKDLTATNLQVIESLPSGKYRLTVTVTDYAKNTTTKSIEFTIKYNVNMVYFDNTETRHEVGTIRVYTNGFYEGLQSQVTINGKTSSVDWYDNTNYGGDTYVASTVVTKTSTHTLYGVEKRNVIPESDYPHCNNDNDFTYDGESHELVTAKPGYHVTNNVQTVAGDHIIVAMPDANYIWADNTRTYKIVQCTIKKYPVTTPVDACQQGLVFNDKVQTLIKQTFIDNNKTSFGYTAYNINPITGKDAGTYNVVFTLWDANNYIWDDNTSSAKNFSCKIDPYKVSFNPSANPCKDNLVYNSFQQKLVPLEGGLFVHTGAAQASYRLQWNTGDIYTIKPYLATNAGSYNVVYTLLSSNFVWSDGSSGTKTYTCKIDKYKATVTAKDQEKVYDGTELKANSECSISSLPSPDEYVQFMYACETSGGQTDVGTSPKKLDSVTITLSGHDVTSNFDITKKNGTLKVTPRGIQVTTTTESKVYDGTPLTPQNDCEVIDGTLVSGHTISCTNKGTITYVGTEDKVIDTVTIKNGNKDVTSNYDITKKNSVLGISSRPISIKADDESYTYDDKEHVVEKTCSVEAGDYGLAANETMTCTTSGKRTTAGTADKTITGITIKHGAKDVTNQYAITKNKGTLTINKRKITVTATAEEYAYDGKKHTAQNTCTVTSGSVVSGHTLGCTCSGEITNPGNVDKKITGVTIKKGSTNVKDNYEVTPVNSKITIIKRAVTIQCKNQSKQYDGTALKAENTCSVTSGSLLSGHTAACTCSGSQTDVGENTKTITVASVKKGSTNVSSYYIITPANGKLTVTKRAITIQCKNQSKTYDGTELKAENTCSVTSGSLLSGHTATCTCTGSRTAVGESTKTITAASVSKGASNYEITQANGKLTVNKRSITVKADNQSKDYDGKALTALNTCSITSGSLLSGHSISCSCTGSQTKVGSSKKKCTVTITGTGSSGVYSVTEQEGTLTVNDSDPITVSGASTCNKYWCSYYIKCATADGRFVLIDDTIYKFSLSSDSDTTCKTAYIDSTCNKPMKKSGGSTNHGKDFRYTAYNSSGSVIASGSRYATRADAVSTCKYKINNLTTDKKGKCVIKCGP